MRVKHRNAAILAICFASMAHPGFARAQTPTPTRNIYSFPPNGGDYPYGPSSGLAASRTGELYGVMPTGGPPHKCNHALDACGTIYRLLPPAAQGQPWTEQTLYAFASGSSGYTPFGTPLLDSEGNVYGTASSGGLVGARHGTGTIWKLSPPAVAGGQWTFAVLYTFSPPTAGAGGGPEGGNPDAGLVADRSGTLYGTTNFGGAANLGVAFSLTPPPAGSSMWNETVLHSFGSRDDGAYPSLPLTLSPDQETLSGVTSASLNAKGGAAGALIYRLRRQGSNWTYHKLYRFAVSSDSAGGEAPSGPLILDRNDDLFGTTAQGGANGNCGTVFELSPPAAGETVWTEQVLHSFDVAGGCFPEGGVVSGRLPPALFGTAEQGGGGATAGGVVFRLDPPVSGTGPWTYTKVHVFDDSTGKYHGQASLPASPLAFGPNHFLFGVANEGGFYGNGAVFAQTPH